MKTLHSITCCQTVPENAAHDVPPTMIEHMLITEYCDGATSWISPMFGLLLRVSVRYR